MSNVIIDLKNIDITFTQKRRTIQAVKDVSIQIEKGDIYGIVGYSGAGKSTLVRAINLLQVPTAGKITIGLTETAVNIGYDSFKGNVDISNPTKLIFIVEVEFFPV